MILFRIAIPGSTSHHFTLLEFFSVWTGILSPGLFNSGYPQKNGEERGTVNKSFVLNRLKVSLKVANSNMIGM